MSAGDPKVIATSVRVGFDVEEVFTLSGRFTGVPGPGGRNVGGSFRGDPSDVAGMSGWQLLGELRAHTSGPAQIHFGFAAGVGQLLNWQCACTEANVMRGHPAFSFLASAGLRLRPETWNGFSVGAEVIVPHWVGLEDARQAGTFTAAPEPVTAWAVLGGIGYRWP
jgi:hypothetical protein